MDNSRYVSEVRTLTAQLMEAYNHLVLLEQRRTDAGATITPPTESGVTEADLSGIQYGLQKLALFMNGDPASADNDLKTGFRANFNRLVP